MMDAYMTAHWPTIKRCLLALEEMTDEDSRRYLRSCQDLRLKAALENLVAADLPEVFQQNHLCSLAGVTARS